ncbi:hypothetical protein LCGC14_1667300 [marine sediment metagenome]|uniref:HNH nuclease domain-containing protein n=1 Tax=marine sediment metagenome TaxID=412755 RepID=A0A0F9HS99_9ZZZZ
MGYSIPVQTFLDRFWSKVEVKNPDECWNWKAGKTSDGYGIFYVGWIDKKPIREYAHRLMWELNFVQIPKGLQVLHKCDNPPCVNPAHLFCGTQGDNVRDAVSKGRLIPDIEKAKSVFRNNPELQARGERQGSSKLTAKQVSEIRLEYAGKYITQRELAKKYGVRQVTIWAILQRKTWDHIQ